MMNIKPLVMNYLYDATTNALNVVGISNTTLPVIFSHESGLEPANTYCLIHILGMEQQGRVSEATFVEPENDELWFTSFYTLKTQFSFIGKKSENYGYGFRHHVVNNVRFREEYQKKNLSVTYRSDLRDQPQPRETQWMPVQNMDLNFSFAVQTRQAVDWVEFITVNGETYRIYNDD